MELKINIHERIRYWKDFILFFIFLSIILFICQLYVLWILAIDRNLQDFIILFKDNINIFNIFLNNFLNQDLLSLGFNLGIMWIGLILLFLTTKMGKKVISLHIFLVFLISPLILSLVNVGMMRAISLDSLIGFSGIASVFLGYGFYSLSYFIYQSRSIPNTPLIIKNNAVFVIIIILILPILFLALLADLSEIQFIIEYGLIQGIIKTIRDTGTNIVAHVCGYMIGIVLPFTINPIASIFISNE